MPQQPRKIDLTEHVDFADQAVGSFGQGVRKIGPGNHGDEDEDQKAEASDDPSPHRRECTKHAPPARQPSRWPRVIHDFPLVCCPSYPAEMHGAASEA